METLQSIMYLYKIHVMVCEGGGDANIFLKKK